MDASLKFVLELILMLSSRLASPYPFEKIISELRQKWPTIYKVLISLNENALIEEPKKVYTAAETIFSFIINESLEIKNHYSLTTKFFHWCTRKHFPIVDLQNQDQLPPIRF